MTVSPSDNPNASGLQCQTCGKPISTRFRDELICFDCWNHRHLAEPQRHNHKIQPPKSQPRDADAS